MAGSISAVAGYTTTLLPTPNIHIKSIYKVLRKTHTYIQQSSLTNSLNINKNMSQRPPFGTPPTTLHPIPLRILLQHLKHIDEPLAAIIPVQLADLGLVVEEVHPAFAAATAARADFADAVCRDGEFVDVGFG